MKEKDVSYYQGQVADIKEDIIIRIMKLMRAKHYITLQDPDDAFIYYGIIEEVTGAKTLGVFYNFFEKNDFPKPPAASIARVSTPIEKLLDVLEVIENAQE